MYRSFFLAILAIIPAGIVLFGVGDAAISIADTSIPDNEVSSGVSKASNSSASAIIVIRMHALPDE